MPELAPARSIPSVFSRGHALYLVDRAGVHWSVFDCLMVSGHLVVVGTGSRSAEIRMFAPASGGGPQRRYEFTVSEPRELDAITLEQQLAQSEPIEEAE